MRIIRHGMALALFVLLFWAPAHAAGDDTCMPIGLARGNIERHGGEWIEMTHDQAVVLRWVFRTSPVTPDRFPYGDGAAVAKIGSSTRLFFVDGDLACDMTPIPPEVVEMLRSDEFAHPAHAPGRL